MEIKVSDIQAGDVLLCFSSMTANETQAAGTGYSHSAIALADQQMLEASNEGATIASVESLLNDYDHIAVLRSDLWCQSSLELLENFANQASGKKFNLIGIKKFPERKERYQVDQIERVKRFFEETKSNVATVRGVYFCSELTTSALIHVGIIDQSAAEVFTPETFSPSDIAMDKVFGFFCGYVKSSATYVVPDSDYFKSSV